MTGAAKVRAIDAVETLAIGLRRFQEEAAAILEELQMQVNHAVDWVDNDLKTYWRDAERRAWQDISEARAQLEQARTARRVAQFEPSCHDEKKALERAQQRQRVAQAELDKLRHWSHAVNRAVIEFDSGISPLCLFLETDLPRGLSALRHMTVALETYIALQMPEGTLEPAPAAPPPTDGPPVDGPPATTGQEVAQPVEEPAKDVDGEEQTEEEETKDEG